MFRTFSEEQWRNQSENLKEQSLLFGGEVLRKPDSIFPSIVSACVLFVPLFPSLSPVIVV